jgi:hypothetical protein
MKRIIVLVLSVFVLVGCMDKTHRFECQSEGLVYPFVITLNSEQYTSSLRDNNGEKDTSPTVDKVISFEQNVYQIQPKTTSYGGDVWVTHQYYKVDEYGRLNWMQNIVTNESEHSGTKGWVNYETAFSGRTVCTKVE